MEGVPLRKVDSPLLHAVVADVGSERRPAIECDGERCREVVMTPIVRARHRVEKSVVIGDSSAQVEGGGFAEWDRLFESRRVYPSVAATRREEGVARLQAESRRRHELDKSEITAELERDLAVVSREITGRSGEIDEAMQVAERQVEAEKTSEFGLDSHIREIDRATAV